MSLKVFGFICNDLDIRLISSSGGAFYYLARGIILNNGVCYGATINESGNVFHSRITQVSDIYSLMGSKYVESFISKSIYLSFENDVRNDKQVLFVGTPCQINIMFTFLKTKKLDSDNVFFVQLFCHGVPDIYYWNKYLAETGAPDNISFRIKKPSWNKYSVCLRGKRNIELYYKNPYMFLFLNNYILAEKCFDCSFKGENSCFDLAIGDFWGIEKIDSKFYSKHGVSLVISKGDSKSLFLLSILKQHCQYSEYDFDIALKYNTSFSYPPKKPTDLRSVQLLLESNYSFNKCKKYIKNKNKNHLFNKIKKILRKVIKI